VRETLEAWGYTAHVRRRGEAVQAMRDIPSYRVRRWVVERFLRVLKHGCQSEPLRVPTAQRLLNAMALYLIGAWRLHQITRAGHAYPPMCPAKCSLNLGSGTPCIPGSITAPACGASGARAGSASVLGSAVFKAGAIVALERSHQQAS
jgi:hypothetical protein